MTQSVWPAASSCRPLTCGPPILRLTSRPSFLYRPRGQRLVEAAVLGLRIPVGEEAELLLRLRGADAEGGKRQGQDAGDRRFHGQILCWAGRMRGLTGPPDESAPEVFHPRGQAAAPPWCRNVAALRLLATSVRAQARSMNPVRLAPLRPTGRRLHRDQDVRRGLHPCRRSRAPPGLASPPAERRQRRGVRNRCRACAPPGAMTGRSGLAPRYPGPSGLLLQRGLVDRLPRLREYPSQHRLELARSAASRPSGRRPGCRSSATNSSVRA